MSVVFIEAAMFGDFCSSRVDHADSGDTDDVRRARIVSWVSIREGEQGAGQPLADARAPESIERGDGIRGFCTAIALEPNQNAIIPDVERARLVRSTGDWPCLALTMIRVLSTSPRFCNAIIICPIDVSTNLMALRRPGLGVAAGSR